MMTLIQSAEYTWLEEQDAKLAAVLKDVADNYKNRTDENIESAISDMQSAIDGLYRRRRDLDEGRAR